MLAQRQPTGSRLKALALARRRLAAEHRTKRSTSMAPDLSGERSSAGEFRATQALASACGDTRGPSLASDLNPCPLDDESAPRQQARAEPGDLSPTAVAASACP